MASLGRVQERQKEMLEKVQNGLKFDKNVRGKDIKSDPKT